MIRGLKNPITTTSGKLPQFGLKDKLTAGTWPLFVYTVMAI